MCLYDDDCIFEMLDQIYRTIGTLLRCGPCQDRCPPAVAGPSGTMSLSERRRRGRRAICSTDRRRRNPPTGSERRSSRRLQTHREPRLLASRVPPVVDLQLDAAWITRRPGIKAESQQWVNSDSKHTKCRFCGIK